MNDCSSERSAPPDPLASDRFVPGDGDLLTTLVALVEGECGDVVAAPPLSETVDCDALERLLDDGTWAANVVSVTFPYRGVVVRVTGGGRIELYDDSDAVLARPMPFDDDATEDA